METLLNLWKFPETSVNSRNLLPTQFVIMKKPPSELPEISIKFRIWNFLHLNFLDDAEISQHQLREIKMSPP